MEWIFLLFLAVMAFAIGSIRRNSEATKKNTALAAGTMAKGSDVRCPKCKEFVNSQALICKHCQTDLAALRAEDPSLFVTDFTKYKEHYEKLRSTPEWNRATKQSRVFAQIFFFLAVAGSALIIAAPDEPILGLLILAMGALFWILWTIARWKWKRMDPHPPPSPF
jgi:hypothetical protein